MNPSSSYQVRVEKVQFAAAHFATFGKKCEPLHGHSYEVAAEVDGSLAADGWVLDFGKLKRLLRGLCGELDHRFLLQAESDILRIEPGEDAWRVHTPQGTCYILPASDVVALPIQNTTAELLAHWLCGRLWQQLERRSSANIEAIRIEVWEGPGQRATSEQKRLPLVT